MTRPAEPLDFARLFSALPTPMALLRPDSPRFTILAANEAYLRATCLDLDSMVGRPYFDVFPENLAGSGSAPGVLRDSYRRVLSQRRADRLPLTRYDIHWAQTGTVEERYWLPVNSPVLDEQGRVLYILHSAEDVTAFTRGLAEPESGHLDCGTPEQRLLTMQAELRRITSQVQDSHERLIRSERFSRSLVDNSPGVILRCTSRRPWTVLYVSDAVEALTGYPASDFVSGGRTWESMFCPEDVAPIEKLGAAQAHDKRPLLAEYRICPREGPPRWVEVRARLAADDASIVDAAVFDIGERKRAEAALLESQEHLRHVLESVPSVVWTATPDGHIDFVSDAVLEATGSTPDEFLHSRWREFFHPDDRDRAASQWRHSLATGSLHDGTFRLRASDGTYRWYQIRAHCRRDAEGRITRWYGINTNVDVMRQAQTAAEDAVRVKSAFLSAMSHEIRTPLNAVLGFAGLLADTELAAQQRDFVNSIRASGAHLLGVINDILDFSKLESASLSLSLRPCDLRQTVEQALDMVAGQAAARNLELFYTMGDTVPPVCVADQARLRQVLVNLLANAVKFTPAGEVVVRVNAFPVADGAHQFELIVRDTGIGIPADRLEKLFRDFSQVDDSAARRFGGTGLGLAISKRLMEAHGGTIDVHSKVGQGSTFCVRFRSRAPEGAGACAMPPAALRGRRTLVVDDNLQHLRALRSLLESWGGRVVAMTDPEHTSDVIAQARRDGEPFDLVILDQQMPALDGLTLARRLQQSATPPPPLVLLASAGPACEGERGLRDFAAVVGKPTHLDALAKAIGDALAPAPASVIAPGPGEVATAVAAPAMTLLLAEDNLVNRKMALLLLRKLGYTDVDVAVDGLETLTAVATRAYDVVLMDIEMPNLDGLGASRRIRAELPQAQQPQIIALTANAMAEDRRACAAAGMNDYVPKPIDPARLADALLKAAARRGIAARPPEDHSKRSPRDEADARARRITDQVLAGGGEMGALMRRMDWSATPLGPVYTWPQSLRTALSILLSQMHPMYIWWGRELVQFYNDAGRAMLGASKHPRAMGQRAQEAFAEVWDVSGPMIDRVLNHGESTMVERGLLCLDRNGQLEECYFSYGYSPIRDESGGIGGVFIAGSENTVEVLAARRSALLLALDEDIDAFGHASCARQGELLARAASDLPFVLVYRIAADGRTARLVCSSGLPADAAAAPAVLHADDPFWPVFTVLASGRPQVHEPANLPVLPPWPEPPTRALIQPVAGWGAMVAGLSPRLLLDDAYRDFIARVGQRIQRMQVPEIARPQESLPTSRYH